MSEHLHDEHNYDHHDHDHEPYGNSNNGVTVAHTDNDHEEHTHGPEEHDHAGHDPHEGHDHHGHDHAHAHGVSANADFGKLKIGLSLIIGFMLLEFVVGLLVHSLALLSDAGHMLTDAGALIMSMVALKLSLRPAKGVMTYGFKRAGILSALVNGLTLVILACFITYGAVQRLINPEPVEGKLMFFVALVGIVINLLAVSVLAKANRQSLNMEGSFQHILTDLFAFIATAVAAFIIWMTGFYRADAIMSLIVAALMFRSGVPLVIASAKVFLQVSPEGTDPDALIREMQAVPGVMRVNDLHVWSVSDDLPIMTANVVVGNDQNTDQIQDLLTASAVAHGFSHHTIQVDRAHEELEKYSH